MDAIFAFGAGWLIGPFFTEGMESLPEIRGVTGSLMSSFRLAFTAIVIGITGHFFDGTIYPLTYMIATVLSLGALTLLISTKTT